MMRCDEDIVFVLLWIYHARIVSIAIDADHKRFAHLVHAISIKHEISSDCIAFIIIPTAFTGKLSLSVDVWMRLEFF